MMIPAPTLFIYLIAFLLDSFNWFPISRDQINMLLEGNICESDMVFKRYNIIPIEFNPSNLKYLLNGKK